jgi:hypothetical protein
VGRLNREKCKELLEEFADYMDSEKSVEVASDGEKLIRQFCEALCEDDAVRDKFEALLEDAESDGSDDGRQRSRESGNVSNSRSKNGGEYTGDERRKSAGGFHLYERRKKPHQYGGTGSRGKQVQFERGK